MGKVIRRTAIIPVTMAGLLAGAGCSTGSSGDSSAVTYAVRSDPGKLDPALTTNSAASQIDGLAYDALVAVDKSGHIVSNLAKSWTATATQATFSLLKGVKCDDGHELTAGDIAANFNWIKNPANQSPLFGSVLPGSGYTVTFDDAAGRLTIAYGKPNGFILDQLSKVPIVCPSSLTNRGKLAAGTDGTGPFKLTSATPGQSYTFVPRAGYTWGPGGATTGVAHFPGKLTIEVSNNESTAANQLLTADLNIADIRGPDTSRLRAAHLFAQSYPHMTSELFFNQAAGRPLADETVRRALVQATNLGQVAKVNTGSLGTVATRLTDGGSEPCTADIATGSLPAYDVAAANQALDRAGWTKQANGKRAKNGKPLALTLIYPSNAQTSIAAAQLLASKWTSELGIVVKATPLTPAAIDGRWSDAGNWGDVALARASSQLPSDLVGLFSGATPPKGTNFSAIDNPQYDSDAQAAYSAAGASACTAWDKAGKDLLSAANVVPVAAQPSTFFGNGVKFEVGAGTVIPTSIRTN